MNAPATPEPMPRDRWQQIQQVLSDLIERPAAQREALIDVRCAGDLSLRRELESLLKAHDDEGMVDRLAPLVKLPSVWATEPGMEWSGRTVTHFRVQEPVGFGGMSVVYKARDERLGRQVALKFLSPCLSADPRGRSGFVAEARAAAVLDHSNVCTIYEIGESEDGQLFIAMPLYEGVTLQARLDRGRLTFREALPIVLQVARGLGHAHDAGIVHRDVKPSNIMILADGTAKILDFGIAQSGAVPRPDSQTLTGTVCYMSPEQARTLPVDCRSDIWSLAIVIHEMLTGLRPFQCDDRHAVLQAILEQEPRLTSGSHSGVPAGIDRVLRKALAKAPEQRHVSMSLLAAELSALTTS